MISYYLVPAGSVRCNATMIGGIPKSRGELRPRLSTRIGPVEKRGILKPLNVVIVSTAVGAGLKTAGSVTCTLSNRGN